MPAAESSEGAAAAGAVDFAHPTIQASTGAGANWDDTAGAGAAQDHGQQHEPQSAWDAYVSVAGDPPWRPRPMVSVHVRGSDKGREMPLSPFAKHMFFAHRLQRAVPDLRHVWLSTEVQSVIDATSEYRDWTFYFTSNARQSANVSDTRAYDDEQSVELSFAGLLIASECDYFVGALGSNWGRLINELRLTNGRLFSGMVSLNIGEW
eukprot:TRINITY_DN41140_c0_g3_i1.p1 TRINITY_DN41140_c0_g3~~TRINITY_DN41140_c0_g3_i1.p1  ORF type:complete len:221 (-),score=1.27 TRINITY_DN41140_c0_g3_i1:8-628(-)